MSSNARHNVHHAFFLCRIRCAESMEKKAKTRIAKSSLIKQLGKLACKAYALHRCSMVVHGDR
jgi:hypothetical protein